MKGVFDYRDVEQSASRDTELTLSSTTLLMIFFGLVLLCALCFGLGYASGRRAEPESGSVLQPAAGADGSQSDSAHNKPAPNSPPAGQPNPPDQPVTSPVSSSVQDAAVAAAGGSSGSSPTTPQVKPALGTVAASADPTPPPATAVAPALAAAGSLMVQIAAVTQQEDADVLVGALRRRGYAVVAHREPLDGLIHVRIGPFKTRPEAETWRQKLLGDGYNAIVQP